MRTLGTIWRAAQKRRGWSAQRLALELDFLDLRRATAERIEAYEADWMEPPVNTTAAIMTLLGVGLEEVEEPLPWSAEPLQAKLAWYERRAAKMQAMAAGDRLGHEAGA